MSTRQARSTCGLRLAVEQLEVLGRAAGRGEGVEGRLAVVGLVGPPHGDLGATRARRRRHEDRGAPALGGLESQGEERLDQAGRPLGREDREDAVEEVAGRQLALGQHVPGGRHRQRRARRRRAGRPSAVEHRLERGLVGADRGEGQVAVVEQVEVGVRQVERRAVPVVADGARRRSPAARSGRRRCAA